MSHGLSNACRLTLESLRMQIDIVLTRVQSEQPGEQSYDIYIPAACMGTQSVAQKDNSREDLHRRHSTVAEISRPIFPSADAKDRKTGG